MGSSKVLVLAIAVALMLQGAALAQEGPTPEITELKALIEDDERFNQLLTEVWVLRDVLALQVGENVRSEAKEFQALQDRLGDQRGAVAEVLSAEKARIDLSKPTLASASRIAATLESFGVRQDSELGRRLLAAYLQFNQALSAASLGSLCNVHPFRTLCAE